MLEDKVKVQKSIMQATELSRRSTTMAQIKANTKNWEQYVPELSKKKHATLQYIKQSMQAATEELVILVNHFFRPYQVSFRDTLTELPTLEEKAFDLYAKKDYTQALPLLKQLSVNNNKEAKLMLGNTLLIMKEYEAAYLQFEQLIEERIIGYTADAHWYAGLTQLQLNKVEEAKTHFDKIILDDYASKKTKKNAIEILEKLADIST